MLYSVLYYTLLLNGISKTVDKPGSLITYQPAGRKDNTILQACKNLQAEGLQNYSQNTVMKVMAPQEISTAC